MFYGHEYYQGMMGMSYHGDGMATPWRNTSVNRSRRVSFFKFVDYISTDLLSLA